MSRMGTNLDGGGGRGCYGDGGYVDRTGGSTPGLRRKAAVRITIDDLLAAAHLRVYNRCCSPPSAFAPLPVDPIRHLQSWWLTFDSTM